MNSHSPAYRPVFRKCVGFQLREPHNGPLNVVSAQRRDGISRVTWQPSNAQRKRGSDRSCQRRTRGSGDRPMLEEDELAARLDDSFYTLNGLYDIGNRTHRKGAHNCIDARVRQ